jgi:predicted small metal-binding protein
VKQFSCGDVVPGCGATFVATSVDQVLDAVARHASHAHGLDEVPAAVVDAVVANIRETSAA